MTDIPSGMTPEESSQDAGAPAGDEPGENGSTPTFLELVVYVPVGVALLAREAVEKLIVEGAARGEVEVARVRTAMTNEIEIARSLGRARVRGTIRRSSKRLEYPPLSIVAEVVRAIAARGREAIDEVEAAIGIVGERGEGESSRGEGNGVRGEAEPEEALRGKGLATLKSAQRTAASRILKARFGKDPDGHHAEAVRVTFVEDPPEVEKPAPPAKAAPPASLEDYDSLSARQVVARLGGLSDEELEGLVEYETATKSRAAVVERARRELESRGPS